MQKTLIALTAVAALAGAATVSKAYAAPLVQPVQYYEGFTRVFDGDHDGWRHREWRHRMERERWHREHERHERWEHRG